MAAAGALMQHQDAQDDVLNNPDLAEFVDNFEFNPGLFHNYQDVDMAQIAQDAAQANEEVDWREDFADDWGIVAPPRGRPRLNEAQLLEREQRKLLRRQRQQAEQAMRRAARGVQREWRQAQRRLQQEEEDILLEGINRERFIRAGELWHLDRPAAYDILARQRAPDGVRRRFLPRLEMDEAFIPAFTSIPTYRTLEEREGIVPAPIAAFPEVSMVNARGRVTGTIRELGVAQQPIHERLHYRRFQHLDRNTILYRRSLYEVNINEDVNRTGDVIFRTTGIIQELLYHERDRLLGNRTNISDPIVRNANPQHRIFSSIMIHQGDESRYSGFMEGTSWDSIAQRLAKLIGDSGVKMEGNVKIELQVVLEPIQQGQVVPADERRRNAWKLRPVVMQPNRQQVEQIQPNGYNLRRRPAAGNRIVRGYLMEELETNVFRNLEEERDWSIVEPPPSKYLLTPRIISRMNGFQRKSMISLPQKDLNVMVRNDPHAQVGAYELLEPHTKMFMKDSIMKMYAKNGSVLYNPETRSFSCFLMSFLRAECLEYSFDLEAEQFIEVKVVEGDEMGLDGFVATLPQWSNLRRDFPFVHYDVEKQDYILHFFNARRTPVNEEGVYSIDLDAEEVVYWELAAREIEVGLLQSEGEWVDVNDLEVIATIMAEKMDLFIQVYDIQTSSQRAWVFPPHPEESVGQYIERKGGKLYMISLLYDQGHMIPIQQLRKFLTVDLKHELRKGAFCPFCQKQGGGEMKTCSGVIQHVSNCFREYKNRLLDCYVNKPLEVEDMLLAIKPIMHRFDEEERRLVECCIYCYQKLPQSEFMSHRCMISPKKDPKEAKTNDKFYVYDIEAAQIAIPNTTSYYHVCNMLVFKKMYPETEEEKEGLCFRNEYEFMDHLMEHKKYEGCVILAHNGGAYDHQFIVRYLERMKVVHSFIPTPNSMHKYLSITLSKKEITFLDFVHFMPGSLKSISESLGLSLEKGDFPHRFNTLEDTSYRGCIPPIDTEDDYWCLKTKKSVEDIDEMKEFFEGQKEIYCTCPLEKEVDPQAIVCPDCRKKLWILKEEMYFYCKRDVDVLAEACARYRDQLKMLAGDEVYLETDLPWNPTNVEPFDFMTVPQLALQILLKGFGAPIFRNMMDKRRQGQHPEALIWLEEIQQSTGKKILHRQNYHKEYFDYDLNQFVDGYCMETGEIFICLDCDLWACPNCNYANILMQVPHTKYPRKSYYDIQCKAEEFQEIWRYKNGNVKYLCEIRQQITYSPYILKCLQGVPMASFFYGGRTEVFQPYCKVTSGETIQYHDVCSLYPYVCAFEELPFGIPEYIPGFQIESHRLFHTDIQQKYWGYIRARVKPNPHCLLGLLPLRNEDGRLVFSLEEQEGCWGLNEMELAYKNGYSILEVYEIIHWPPSQRSNQLFRGYVNYFLKMKQEAEGWKKLGGNDQMNVQEKQELIERLFASNGFIGRIEMEKVSKNPIRRALAKLFLNSLWGKFAQKPKSRKTGIIYSAQEFIKVWSDRKIIRESLLFRETGTGIFKFQYEMEKEYTQENSKGNLFLAAKVTEHARCILHSQMLRIGPERVLYCDTDSILFLWPETGQDLTGIGLGKWTNEYPSKKIVELYALAPKFYMLVFPEDKTTVKVKGVQLTQPNLIKITPEKLKEMLYSELKELNKKGQKRKKPGLEVEYMSIYSNCQQKAGVQYGVMMTRYGKKIVQFVLSKRQLLLEHEVLPSIDNLTRIRTIPFGYQK